MSTLVSPRLNAKRAASYLGLAVCTLARWRSEGKGPRHIRAGARAIRYDVRDLDDWMDKNKFSSTSDTPDASA